MLLNGSILSFRQHLNETPIDDVQVHYRLLKYLFTISSIEQGPSFPPALSRVWMYIIFNIKLWETVAGQWKTVHVSWNCVVITGLFETCRWGWCKKEMIPTCESPISSVNWSSRLYCRDPAVEESARPVYSNGHGTITLWSHDNHHKHIIPRQSNNHVMITHDNHTTVTWLTRSTILCFMLNIMYMGAGESWWKRRTLSLGV